MSGASFDNRGNRGFQTLARLKPGVSIGAARAELDVISKQLEKAYPATNEQRGVEVSPLAVETFGQLNDVVRSLAIAVGFVLLIACANVANLILGRSETRRREVAVRTALGAGRWRLLRQLVTESTVLTALGAAAGLALALVAVRAVIAGSPVPFPTFVQPQLNLSVILFTAGVAVACGVLVGLAPALHARWSQLTDALKESAKGSGGTRARHARSALAVAEVALAVVLLVGAGLMIRSLQNLAAIDPGFQPANVLTLTASIPRVPAPPPVAPAPGAPPAAPAPPPPLVLSGPDLLARVRAVPGVADAALVTDIPLGGSSSAVFYTAEGDTTSNAQTMPRAYVHRVSPAFFSVLGMPIRAGRAFAESDLTPDSTAVIVSEGVVRRFWPNANPIGKRIKIGSAASANPWLTIAGVAGESNYRGLPANPTPDPDLYFPWLDRTPQSVIVRTTVDPDSVTGAVRGAIRAAHPGIVVYNTASLGSLVDAQTAASRFTTWILGLFAAAALLLSVVGIYGVMSTLVAQQTREFGIRLALGAGRSAILGVVVGQGARLVGLGLVLGLAGAVVLSSTFGSLLFQVSLLDSSAMAAAGLLVVVALAACAMPAWRATRVDPVVALRTD
jgi:putative ABC transport system permease protein